MTNTQHGPTTTVAGQSIALHVTGYPDIPNRWGTGHIRVTGLRLDYGNSRTPDGRHVFITGTWVRDDGEATDAPIDRYYDAIDGDTSDWPDWIAELAQQNNPSAGPGRADGSLRDHIVDVLDTAFESFDPEATEDAQLSGHLADAVLAGLPADIERLHDQILTLQAELAQMRDLLRRENQRANDAIDREETAEQAAVEASSDRGAVLAWAADFAEEVAEKLRAHHEFERSNGALDVMTELRRLAAEAQQTECSASISGSWLRECESEPACDTETLCGPGPSQCDAESGEPCTNHEREAAHAEGEHCFCGPECQDAEPPREETGAALARYIADRPMSEIQAAIRILGWPTLRFELTEIDGPRDHSLCGVSPCADCR
ncbi:hypothetical protein [Streptomyces cylindrosporus]|uniref:Uncharacterized protein n=1 Tax=Streptomyces cylindrosporus TaxID=2927583 RepID=A0ABS9YPE6_9ACTN|nr:hypothetical protein [Streptomyces cylindrosporus]MCI3279138.1 hypothetical protein [Streptomyces cylindrosporus]